MSQFEPADGIDPPAFVPAVDHDSLSERTRARLVMDAEFSVFYGKTVKKLIGFVINHGASLPVAADVAQDTMIKAYLRWGELRRPEAWVHTVASRAYIRRATDLRMVEEPMEQVPEPTSLLPEPNAAVHWETRHDMLRLVRKLPYRQRQIMAWTLSDYTPSEIAEQLDLNPEAVRASLKKARRTLACFVAQEEGQ
jgi:RNA polymerase sigma-70 factor (ECF subfamily)